MSAADRLPGALLGGGGRPETAPEPGGRGGGEAVEDVTGHVEASLSPATDTAARLDAVLRRGRGCMRVRSGQPRHPWTEMLSGAGLLLGDAVDAAAAGEQRPRVDADDPSAGVRAVRERARRAVVVRVVEPARDDAAVDDVVVDVGVVDPAVVVLQGRRRGDPAPPPAARPGRRVPRRAAVRAPRSPRGRGGRGRAAVEQDDTGRGEGRHDVDVAAGAELVVVPSEPARQPDARRGADGA